MTVIVNFDASNLCYCLGNLGIELSFLMPRTLSIVEDLSFETSI